MRKIGLEKLRIPLLARALSLVLAVASTASMAHVHWPSHAHPAQSLDFASHLNQVSYPRHPDSHSMLENPELRCDALHLLWVSHPACASMPLAGFFAAQQAVSLPSSPVTFAVHLFSLSARSPPPVPV